MNRVACKLKTLYEDAKNDFLDIQNVVKAASFRSMKPTDFENAYLPISKHQGEALRQLIIDNGCQKVVEFGTSFGVSTIYLADAVRQTAGKVITTELLESKAKRALLNIEEAGLDSFVEIRIGDAMDTLIDHSLPIDFLLLDGWKDLYLPLFQMLEPNFHTGTLIYADNMGISATEIYANHILGNKNTYTAQFIHQGKGLLTKVL